ncbi:MAG: hypothetical protein GY943_11910, partial [Chloroflexi bacterium]|nr:hypothetical protein [Chloroflexota bacterium]
MAKKPQQRMKAKAKKQTPQNKAKEIAKRAERGVKFVMHAQSLYPAPSYAAREVLENIVTFAMDRSIKEQALATQASFAIRAAWQFGYLQKMPPVKMPSDTVPMLLGTIYGFPDQVQQRIEETSASLYASLRAGHDRVEQAARLHIYVMYAYGRSVRQEKAKETHDTSG